MITELTIRAARRLSCVDSIPRIAAWIYANPETAVGFIEGYAALIDDFNALKVDDPVVQGLMPHTAFLKRILGAASLPSLLDSDNFSVIKRFFEGVEDARDPMFLGQIIKSLKKEHPDVVIEASMADFAIGTPSMDTSTEALVVGVIGHLIERTLFRWAKKNNLQPDSGWGKDMILKALDEVVILMGIRNQASPLENYFVRPNSEDGLGWISKKRISEFVAGYAELVLEK